MTSYAGLDVSDKTIHVCVNADGAALKRDVVASAPEVLAKWLSKHCPNSDCDWVSVNERPLSSFAAGAMEGGSVGDIRLP